ncbi:MAG: hypothetical protein GEU78_11100 [Actinobacteria bacterium]|nr:hypothetical protein [Actinomycetota bacterium]
MPQPKGAWRLGPSLWLKLGGVALAGALLLLLLPQGGGGSEPPLTFLLGAGFFLSLAAAAGLYLALRLDLHVAPKVILFTLAYNVLIVLIKFVLAPQGVYEVNRSTNITGFLNISDAVGAAGAGAIVLLIYAGVYTALYRLTRRRVREVVRARVRSGERFRRIALPLVIGTVLLAAFGGLWVVLFLPLIMVGSGAEYLTFVFSSSLSVVIGFAIVASAGLAALAFGSVAEQQRVTGDAAVLASFFWFGLYFLALYHALWVVYILIITSIWPLKVVTPK